MLFLDFSERKCYNDSKKDIKGGKYFMDKKKLFTASLASVAVLGAGFLASHPSVVKAATVEELQKEAEAKDQALKEAEAKAQSEKEEAATAAAAVEKAKKEKLAADEALAKAKEEADKKAKEEEAAKKEEADTKKALGDALDQLEEAIANDPNITDKEAAKELVDKEGLLKAIEAGEIKASEILAELEDDHKKAEAEANAPATPTPAAEAKKDTLPADIKAGIEKAEKADAARPASEKAQDKADDLGEKADKLKKEAEADAKTAADKVAELEKTNATLKEIKEAVAEAEKNKEAEDVIEKLKAAQKVLEAKAEEQEAEATAAKESADARAEEANKLVDEYNAALKEVEAAKAKEAEEAEDAAIEALQSKVADLEKEVAELEKLVADNENNPDAVDYVTAAKEKLEDKKAELEKTEAELDGKLKRLEPTEENKILDEIDKVKEEIKDAEENEGVEDFYKEGLKNRLADLEEALAILAGNKSEVLDQQADKKVLEVTRYVDIDSNVDILEAEAGNFKGKPIAGYTFVTSEEKDGIITNYYRKVDGNYNKGPQIEQQSGRNGGDYPGDRYIINRPSATPGSTTPSTPANETPATPAPGTDTPAAPTAETPASTAPAVAGTSQDNTYQAPAAKAEDKKELPNTGGKDNAAIASLGFLGLLLGALPFVKRKN